MRSKLLLLAVALAAMVPASANALSLDLYAFSGTVTDPLGRPLAGGAVSDGTRSVTTSGDGSYRLVETTPGTYDLRASHPGTESRTEHVTLLLPEERRRDFALLYRVGAAATPTSTTNAPGSTITVEVRTSVPQPGDNSCVLVTDRTGAQLTATLDATATDGTSTWHATITVEGVAPGSYSISAVGIDCASGTPLTRVVTDSYTVTAAV